MKFLKYFSKTIIALVLLSILVYLGFRAVDYYRGKEYVSYLANHKESVGLNQDFSFNIAEEDLAEKSLILVGEIHGFNVPNKFDINLFEHLLTQYDVQDYLLEMDASQAYFMNKFNKTGDTAFLNMALNKWVVNQGRNNLDYFNKWLALQRLYRQKSFQYHGINNLSDIDLLAEHVNELTHQSTIELVEDASDSINLIDIRSSLTNYLEGHEQKADSSDIMWQLKDLLQLVNEEIVGTYREAVLTTNLLQVYEHFHLKKKKVYGFFGLGHSIQNQLAGFDPDKGPMPYLLRQKDDWFKDEILSFNFFFCDSYMVVKSASLPGVLQDDGEYSRLNVSFDNIWLGYLHGIEDVKRVTSPKSKTIFKLDAEGSPYQSNDRLFSMFKILPIGMIMNAKEQLSATDYGQYAIFVRDSDWAQPF